MVDIQKLIVAQRMFNINNDELRSNAAAFRYDIERGLDEPEASSLRLLPAYTAIPSGRETGTYIALDFGGTNLRVTRFRLLGNGCYDIEAHVARPLRIEGKYDYVGAGSTAEELWGFIADLIGLAISGDKETPFKLGHTFSFPSEQTDLYNAKLICWTKEFLTSGVEGENVNDQLYEALKKKGFGNVKPVAVINDTVAVLLSAAYAHQKTYIGSIYATGHNTCYLEEFKSKKTPMVINTESATFSKLLPNPYDSRLDAMSMRPGEQRLEKMVSGMYLGKLFSLVMSDAIGGPLKKEFTSIDLSAIMAAPDCRDLLYLHTGEEFNEEEAEMVCYVGREIIRRSARLVAATFAGTLWHISGTGNVLKQHIAIEGAVYAKMPYIKETLNEALYDLLGHEASGIELDYIADGSGLGAAIAAAMTD